MNSLITQMDRMWRNIDAMFNYPLLSTDSKFENRGLRGIIKRPHSLTTKKNEDGKVVGYGLSVPYTPFKKNEVSVEVQDHTLVVVCGSENKVKDEEMDFNSISYQSFTFSIPLADNVDVNNITAKAEDGMLDINLPIKQIDEKPETLKIEVK